MYRLKRIFKNEKGQGMVEHGLTLAIVSIVAILGLSTIGGNIKGQFEGITDSMGGISEPGQVPGDSDKEIDDLIKTHHFIPVATADELNNVRSATSETYGAGTKWEGQYTGGLDKQYVQVADIDLSGIENFEPIGMHYGSEFTGIYDGGGYVISNLTIDRGATDVVGLFGWVVGATFKNIGLGNVNVTGGSHVGGLVGYQWSSSVTNSYATGTVNGTGNYTGGLVGRQEGSTISDSYATGSVTSGNYTGGLVGYQYYSSVSNSYATGSVTGGNYTGGLVGGQNNSSVSDSYATGTVNGTGTRTGGLVGLQQLSSTVSNSYATGTVNGGDNTGGLVGVQWYSSTTDSYYDKETTKQSDTGKGTGKTTEEMKNKDTYTDWDNTIWEFKDGQYPTLR